MRLIVVWMLTLGLSACGGGGTPTAPGPGPTPPQPTPGPAGPTVLRAASLRGANGHSASGTVEIVRSEAAHTLEIRADFRIDGGSNDVYLARQTDGITTADLNLGNLRSLNGAQSYPVPNDGSGYPYVLIWCRPFRVPIAFGELR